MNSLSALPRIGERLISRRTYITRNQRIHSLCGYISCRLTCARDLSDLGVEHSLLVRIDFKRSQHIYLLDQQQRCILLSKLLGYLCQKPSCFSVLVSLSIKLNSFHLLVLFDQMGGILLKELLYLYETMLLSQLYSKIPLVEQDTAIDSFLGITKLDVGVYSLLAESH